MSNERRIQLFAAAVACALLACNPLSAYAADSETGTETPAQQVDLSPVTDLLDSLDRTQQELDEDVDTLSERMQAVEEFVTEDSTQKNESLEEIKELVQSEETYELPAEVVDALARIDSNVESLANPPVDAEEEEVEEETPYITLEGVAQLLMLNVAVNAASLGVKLFSRFWDVFLGGR